VARSYARFPQLPDTVQNDLLKLVENASDILKFLEETATEKPSVLPERFARPLAERLAISVREARRVLNALQNLELINQETADHEKTFEIIEGRLPAAAREKWIAAKDVIFAILRLLDADHPAVLSEKARRISYLYEHIFVNAEILTDLRPVFTIKGDDIIDMIIQHKLVITQHDSSHRDLDLHFVMDARDVINLKTACERAILKAQVLKDAFANSPWATEVLSDDAET
jgi:DNA-binding Lrp family transcriptional regulator